MKLNFQAVLYFINILFITLSIHLLTRGLNPYAYGAEHRNAERFPEEKKEKKKTEMPKSVLPNYSQRETAQTNQSPILDLNLVEELEQQILALQAELDSMKVVEKNSSEEGLQAHKSTYVLPLTLSSPIQNRLQEEIQFRISIKQKVIGFKDFKLYAAYSQKSFFQFYDEKNSRPFRETNHNPELFIRTPEYQGNNWGLWQVDTGYEHESNGLRVPDSRSWDRLYIHFRVKLNDLTLKYKTWYRLPEDEKESPTDSEGDDNPDIEDFYGRQEARVEWIWGRYILSMMGRYSFDTEKGGGEINVTFPLLGKTRGLIQYWSGYGESLIDYDRSLTKIGIGLSFNQ